MKESVPGSQNIVRVEGRRTRRRVGQLAGWVAAFASLGLPLSHVALAACTNALPAGAAPTAAPAAAQFIDAVYRPGQDQDARPMQVWREQDDDAAIVGLWKFEWRAAGTPQFHDGDLVDFGLIQWHDDGTEMTISGGRAPAVSDVCMGVWRQVGRSTYQLKHLAMGYGPPPGPATGYQGLTLLTMKVVVDPGGRTYHGKFTLTQYRLNFNPGVPNSEFDDSAVDYTITGTVKATRVVAD